MTDKFVETCGLKNLMKIASLIPGKNLSKVPYKDIKSAIKKYVEPSEKLIIAERTNFFQMQQDNETVPDFLSRLNKASESCHFEKLLESNPVTELIN